MFAYVYTQKLPLLYSFLYHFFCCSFSCLVVLIQWYTDNILIFCAHLPPSLTLVDTCILVLSYTWNCLKKSQRHHDRISTIPSFFHTLITMHGGKKTKSFELWALISFSAFPFPLRPSHLIVVFSSSHILFFLPQISPRLVSPLRRVRSLVGTRMKMHGRYLFLSLEKILEPCALHAQVHQRGENADKPSQHKKRMWITNKEKKKKIGNATCILRAYYIQTVFGACISLLEYVRSKDKSCATVFSSCCIIFVCMYNG